MNTAAQDYLEARVMTAAPQSLHLLVVEGALRHATRAEQALDAGDREAAHAALDEARAFVGELIGGLDKAAAPEIAASMAALFTFAYRRLVEADLYGSSDKVRDAAKVLRTHRDTWTELLTRLSACPAEQTASPSKNAKPTPHVARRMPAEYDEYEPRSWCG